jgi:hypothetical protein
LQERKKTVEFTVKFVPVLNYMAVISLPARPVGLGLVDEARYETNVPDLELERISCETNAARRGTYDIRVAEQFARSHADLFAETHTVVVQVPSQWLNKYHYLQTKFQESRTTGEVCDAVFVVEIDDASILYEWEVAGAPLRWGLDEDAEDDNL